jgi:hypothetical protein
VCVYLESSLRSVIKPSTLWILGGLTIFSISIYLFSSFFYYRIGFPLDDAWIHQTYARNLAFLGEWVFSPGQISGGSTSPLWTILISIGYLIQPSPFLWTFGLGVLSLWFISVFAEITARRHIPSYRTIFPWVGCLLIFEWHLVWAAASGMETLIFSGMVLWVILLLTKEAKSNYFKIGILIGVCIWFRPEGITLLGPAFLVGLMEKVPLRQKLNSLLKIGLGFGGLFSLYLLFMLTLTGRPWPTTFYAKQAEYAVLVGQSFIDRFGGQLIQPIIGVGSVFLPGAILIFIKAIRQRNWGILAGFFWLIGMMGLYAWRLPVVYQHGRYTFPSMLVFFTFSCVGMVGFFQNTNRKWGWIVKISWKVTTGVILLIFWIYGATIYARDVAIIESEMVETARWVAKNTDEDALIASHDIGALGYFGQHAIVDLAGLITPDVIPFMSSEIRLREYLDAQGVDYLVTFPGWYPDLVKGLPEVYSTNEPFAPAAGGENMSVFLWRD